ncbi:transposase [Enterocloster citroniae]|uniref:transposase n=1 Tax=Enterocloster citroniae TaxID=358743 RepID=UPI002E8DF40B|nr:transposase [Enterocloster citroniae]
MNTISSARLYGTIENVRKRLHRSIPKRNLLNASRYGLINGPTEGFNNKITVLKRNSYGIWNFKRFRTWILHCTS